MIFSSRAGPSKFASAIRELGVSDRKQDVLDGTDSDDGERGTELFYDCSLAFRESIQTSRRKSFRHGFAYGIFILFLVGFDGCAQGCVPMGEEGTILLYSRPTYRRACCVR